MYKCHSILEYCHVSWSQVEYIRSFVLFLYLTATENDAKSDKVKASVLLTCISKRGREVYNTFTFASEGDELKLKTVVEKFDEYCQPRKNITFLRHKFSTRKQKSSETFHDFITELKKVGADCGFGLLCDELMRDTAICGLLDNC